MGLFPSISVLSVFSVVNLPVSNAMVTGLVCEPREYTKSWSTNSLGLPIVANIRPAVDVDLYAII